MLNKRYAKYIIILIVFVFIFALTFCSRTKPEITFGFIQLVLYQGDEKPEECYSIFILPEDEDGLENLEEMYIYHDKEQLRWHLKNNEWISYSQDEKTWIGTRSLTIQDGLSLPRGVYRVVLVNKGGEKGERSFTYDGGPRFPFPEIEFENGLYIINSQWPSNRLVCFDRVGNYTSIVNVPSLSGNISQLNLSSSVRSVSLWAEDVSYSCSAYTNVVSVR
jgi:hypothetical protein